jgi:hypothetical protein
MSGQLLRLGRVRFLAVGVAAVVCGAGADDVPERAVCVTPEIQAVLDRISPDSLRGHLSFLASDLLEGRGTPSRGLDLAAAYIAAQFRRAALEPLGDDGYFQTARWCQVEPSTDGFSAEIRVGDKSVRIDLGQISLRRVERAIDLRRVPLRRLGPDPKAVRESLCPGELKGQAVVIERPDPRRVEPSKLGEAFAAYNNLQRLLAEEQAALVVTVDRSTSRDWGFVPGSPVDPEGRGGAPRARAFLDRLPWLAVHDPGLIKLCDALPAGAGQATLSLHVAAVERTIQLRNVAGLLRGSDPALRDTYVLVSAHYDHLGLWPNLEGDQIFNGANDDGSGTVSVIELASALAGLRTRPRRSLVFITFFGEEHGLLGSRYYARHPVVPVAKTVADVNIEQVGRTDDSEGPRVAAATVTGFDYSSLAAVLQAAGTKVGIKVDKHPRFSDGYFGASDNRSLAELGIPAHTVSVAYQFPDYHQVGDHWEKVDFANMARVDRMIALGLLLLANDAVPPRWNESNPKAAPYARAAQERRRSDPK